MTYNLITKKGFVSVQGLACGYVEQAIFGNIHLNLWQEHGVYHVRAHDFGKHGRLFWDSFTTVSVARQRFNKAADMIQLSTKG